jgi:Cu/Zn superoxide dismutase
MRNVALILAALSFLGGCGSGDGGGEGGSGEVTVDLAEQNGSGESGTVTLTADGEKTKVVIALENPPAVPQPAHIHKGSCEDLDPSPAYGLTNVVDGNSSSNVDVSLDKLRDGAFAVNVHESGAELDVYVACGDIGSADSKGGYGGGY